MDHIFDSTISSSLHNYVMLLYMSFFENCPNLNTIYSWRFCHTNSPNHFSSTQVAYDVTLLLNELMILIKLVTKARN